MLALGVDTSNYATSLALVDIDSREVVYTDKAILPVKPGELGLRQSEALFCHVTQLIGDSAPLTEALEKRGDRVAAVGVSEKPRPVEGSYMPCFLAGVNYASAFASGAKAHLVKTSHQQGHIMAARYAAGEKGFDAERCLAMHFSGGTTEILLTDGTTIEAVMGQSLDLYAGQAIDRLGGKFGYAFPAGPAVSALALECGEEIKVHPSMKGGDISLSGLENRCAKLLSEGKSHAYVAKYCLLTIAMGAQQMIEAAREIAGPLAVLCAGGVMASAVIRDALEFSVSDIFFVPPAFSSDNAVGVALIAAEELQGKGRT